MLNLLSNAVKFTPGAAASRSARGRRRAGCDRHRRHRHRHPKHDALAKLGRPFEQVESQLTKSHQGSGLGLAIAKSLTELHGGTMRIRSTLGKGTIVLLRLPVDGRPAQREELAEAV